MSRIGNVFRFPISVLIVCSTSASGFGADVYSGCVLPPREPAKHAFYVDPIHGNMANDGSAGAPWSTLQEVIAKGMIETRVYKLPHQPDPELVPPRTHTEGKVHPGDVIYLRSGDHGDITLVGVNDDFITIEAEPEQTPVISHLKTWGASKWIVRSITFRGNRPGGWFVELMNHGWQGPSDNIIFDKNLFLSSDDVRSWTADDWKIRGRSGISSAARCSTIWKNQLTNIRNGIMISGENSLVEQNIIDQFADDGIDIIGSNISVIGNRITNNHGIGDGNHNDGIQGWTQHGQVNDNVLIADNVVINSTDAQLPLPGEMQGINVFDGKWQHLRVLRNHVVTNLWHGITLFGVTDSIIEGNTVIGADPRRISWISIGNMKREQGGEPPRNVILRNNVAPKFLFPVDNSGRPINKNGITSYGNRCYQSGNHSDTTYDC